MFEVVDDEITATATMIMKAFDVNKDGVLSKKEFTSGLKKADPSSELGKHLVELFGMNWRAKSNILSIFNEIDENHDGQLELEELKHYITRLDESTQASKQLVARRMSTCEDEDMERALFDKYAGKDGLLKFSDFSRLWKELGSELYVSTPTANPPPAN